MIGSTFWWKTGNIWGNTLTKGTIKSCMQDGFFFNLLVKSTFHAHMTTHIRTLNLQNNISSYNYTSLGKGHPDSLSWYTGKCILLNCFHRTSRFLISDVRADTLLTSMLVTERLHVICEWRPLWPLCEDDRDVPHLWCPPPMSTTWQQQMRESLTTQYVVHENRRDYIA